MSKKICVIPDVHGNNKWKDFVDPQNDLHVFLGDYVDHWTRTDEEILNNFADIIEFANNYPTVLLLGNHEMSYIKKNEVCSGYRPSMKWSINELYEKNEKLFKVAYQQDNYLFTHAGVSNDWWKYFLKHRREELYFPQMNIADQLNRAWEFGDYQLLLTVGRRRGGFDIGGPLWADERDTNWSPISDIHQVVGHTPQNQIVTVKEFIGIDSLYASIMYTDCLDKLTEPIIITI